MLGAVTHTDFLCIGVFWEVKVF